MASITELARDAFGINEYNMAKRRAELSIPFEVHGSPTLYGVTSAGLHIATPLHFREVEHVLSDEPTGIHPMIGMLVDVASYGAIFGIANMAPDEFLPRAIAAKILYNLGASVVSRVAEARTKKA